MKPGIHKVKVDIDKYTADIILLAEDTDSFAGWKNNMSCSQDCADLNKFEPCMMCRGYSFDDLVLSHNGQFNRTYKIAGHGPEHIISPAPGQIKYSPEENTLKLSFKTSLSYIITFVDPKYQVVSVHPTAIPKTQ